MSIKNVLLPLVIMAGMVGTSNASQITLDPGSLPSTQGWEYTAVNLHAGAIETDIFSTDGSTLSMNTMDEPFHWSSKGSVTYRQYDVVSAGLPTVLEWTSRTLEYEYDVFANNFGFSVGFSDGSWTYYAGIRPTQVSLFDGAEWQNIALDTTVNHTYRMETIAGTSAYNFFIDDALEASVTARSVSGVNYLSFGDGTAAANSRTDISALEFTQIPEPGTTGLIGIFAGGVIFVRRFFLCALI